MNNKRFQRTNKAFSALKFNQKWNNFNKLNDKDFLEFYRKHPGYLYYKEIVSNMKIKQVNKKRAFTGKDINFNNKKYLYKRINFSNTNYNYNYNYNKSDKFPKTELKKENTDITSKDISKEENESNNNNNNNININNNELIPESNIDNMNNINNELKSNITEENQIQITSNKNTQEEKSVFSESTLKKN